MTLASPISSDRNRLLDQQHLVMHDVSWSFYEDLLAQIENRPLRVTFDHGRLEIMAPLPEHEVPKGSIGRLLEAMADELDIPLSGFGSSTFRREDLAAGLEPDECYYLENSARVQGMKRFDPAIYPPPDLAIEIDITSRSIPRQPIYAALGVPELWRFDGFRLLILLLRSGVYCAVGRSPSFPFLPIDKFGGFVRRMLDEPPTSVVREFRVWVRTLQTR
jgi:Uma2 family endonuclease